MSEGKSKVYKVLSGLNAIKWTIALKGILSGLVTGFLVVLYRLGIEYGTETAVKIYARLQAQPMLILPWVALIAVAGLLIAWLIRWEPMASGSGIPQVEGIVLYGLKIRWYTVLAVRFTAGILSSFFGLSLGREGPSIQIGASGSQAIAKKISKNKLEENYLITGGAAAGLSAAFNAPLSGMVFALEELHRSFSGIILLAATTAALTADVVSKFFFGLRPVLSFEATPQLPIHFYYWLLPLGLLSGIVGVLLSKGLLRFQTLYKKLPWFLRPGIALAIALPCGLFLPQVLGGGQNLIHLAENADAGITAILLLITVKFLFTCTSFGSGTPGGIFMPILSVGALSGGLLGVIANRYFGLPAEYIPDFAVCAMAGALSGSVKAPVTSILLVAEMTGSLVHLLPVAACSFVALLLSDILKVTPIYEALLERIVEKDGTVAKSKPGGLLEIPVEAGSCAAGKLVSEIVWPKGTLVAGIRRGDREIIPNGSTRISPGDYLVILSSEITYKDMATQLRELCHYNL